MPVLGSFLGATATVLNILLVTLQVVILVDVVLSWMRWNDRNPLVEFVERVSRFVCDPLRRLFPTEFGGLDLAPFIAMLVLIFLQRFLVGSLAGIAARMG